MARIDDYVNARRLAAEALAGTPTESLLARSGFKQAPDGGIRVPFLDRTYLLDPADFSFRDAAGAPREVPIQEQVLILHYLQAAQAPPPSGQWVSYREIPGAAFYHSAFVKRAIDPLKKVFGGDAAAFRRAAARLRAEPIEAGDAGCRLAPLPRVPLQLIVHLGDEEFPAEANILFDRTAGDILSPEDLAWLAGMVVYRLIALARA